MEPIKSPETAAKAITWISRACFIPVLATNTRPYKMIRANLRRQSEVVQASSSTNRAYNKCDMSASVTDVHQVTCLQSPFDLFYGQLIGIPSDAAKHNSCRC